MEEERKFCTVWDIQFSKRPRTEIDGFM